jgi:acetyl esterase
MPLDPQVKSFLDQLASAAIPPVESLTPREARLQMEAGTVMLGRLPEVGRVEDLTLTGPAGPVRARLTAPPPSPGRNGPMPGLVYFHGGGFVCGSLYSHDHLCRALTRASGLAVISVDYRLAPEHPFPAALEDAEAATSWVAGNARELGLDPERIAVGGDSAGGNLAAVVARRFRDKGGPALAAQLLIYPATDADFDTPSYLENADGYFLTRSAMIWYWDQYVPDPSRRADPDAAPLRAPSLAGLPPAVVMTAEYDPLRDEGEAYARRLADAGVPVRRLHYDGMIHGFLRRHHLLSRGKTALAEVGQALRATLGLPTG